MDMVGHDHEGVERVEIQFLGAEMDGVRDAAATVGSFSQNGPEVALSRTESICLNFFPEEGSGVRVVAQPILAVLLGEDGREPNNLQVRKMGTPSGCQWGRLRW